MSESFRGARTSFSLRPRRSFSTPRRFPGRLSTWGIVNTYVAPAQLRDRLAPARIRALRETIEARRAEINTDLRPAAYYFASVLWSSQFGGIESKTLEALARLPLRLLLDLPLLVFAAALLAGFRKARRSGSTAAPAFVLGLTSMAVEVMVLIWFQTRFGFVYDQIAVLLAAFMFGLAAGSFAAARKPVPPPGRIVALQGAIVLLIFALGPATAIRPFRLLPYLVLFVPGGFDRRRLRRRQRAFHRGPRPDRDRLRLRPPRILLRRGGPLLDPDPSRRHSLQPQDPGDPQFPDPGLSDRPRSPVLPPPRGFDMMKARPSNEGG